MTNIILRGWNMDWVQIQGHADVAGIREPASLSAGEDGILPEGYP